MLWMGLEDRLMKTKLGRLLNKPDGTTEIKFLLNSIILMASCLPKQPGPTLQISFSAILRSSKEPLEYKNSQTSARLPLIKCRWRNLDRPTKLCALEFEISRTWKGANCVRQSLTIILVHNTANVRQWHWSGHWTSLREQWLSSSARGQSGTPSHKLSKCTQTWLAAHLNSSAQFFSLPHNTNGASSVPKGQSQFPSHTRFQWIQ